MAVDVFGRDVTRGGPEACADAMGAFVNDRVALQHRLTGVVNVISALPDVDPAAMAAIGFCFGGLCVLDVARHGTHLRAVASFRGLLTAPQAASDPIPAKVSILHGWDDPYAPPSDVVALTAELTARDADWQVHAYGGAMHAFMAPFADAPERGIMYDEKTARRARASLVDLLSETFDR